LSLHQLESCVLKLASSTTREGPCHSQGARICVSIAKRKSCPHYKLNTAWVCALSRVQRRVSTEPVPSPHQLTEIHASVFEEHKTVSPLHPNRIKGRIYRFASFHKYEGRVPFMEEHKFASQNNAFLSLSQSCVRIKKKGSRVFPEELERRLQ